MPESLKSLRNEIEACAACPRLRDHCEGIGRVKRKAYEREDYWTKPIAGFGDPRARLMVVGLAPGAHGANRTGRVFTGDRSGEWLYRALHEAGFANRPASLGPGDGLELMDAYVSCVVKCAPPGNKPAPEELGRCRPHLARELEALTRVQVWLALGQVAAQGIWPLIGGAGRKRLRFAHGARVEVPGRGWLMMSYHPSQQNTFTGRLTKPMFDSIFAEARRLLTD